MTRKDRPYAIWLRCAKFIASQYEKSQTGSTKPALSCFVEPANQLSQLQRRLLHARSRRWKAAESGVLNDYHRHLRRLREQIETELAQSERPAEFSINEWELLRDLLVLSEEFASASFNRTEMRLSAITKDVSLEHLELGAFRIELHLDSLSTTGRPYYEVIATDANCSSSNEDVTHPHVQDARLCEGDAQPAIKLALAQGRLLDFFQLVENVLGTYNPASAYVTIRDWGGTTCGHCGHTADPEDCRECARCDAFICDSCVYRCNDCEDCFCGNCDEPCSGCLESTCKSCIGHCTECDERHCSDCLSENERCTSCEEKAKEDSKSGDAKVEIHTERVGEAVVSA